MITKTNKNSIREKRHARMRTNLKGTPERPRFNVYRSTSNIYIQVIDDVAGKTLASCSSLEKELKVALKGKNKKEQAKIVGMEAAKRAMKKKITEVVFDRGGYLYTGRARAAADGAREAGLKF